MTKWEYLWVMITVDGANGHVWVRQGNPEQLGVAPSSVPITFAHWNEVLNHLGGESWELIHIWPLERERDEQTWVFKREVVG